MNAYDKITELLLEVLHTQENSSDAAKNVIPLGISNRHIHLSQPDIATLFGADATLTKLKDLSQPGQFACKEVLTLAGPKGVLQRVRILGPARNQTQVELLRSDCFQLGVDAPVRMSGDLSDTPGITLIGPKGTVVLSSGVVVAQRHIHMSPTEAESFGVTDGQIVALEFTGIRGGTYGQVAIRVHKDFSLDCHIDLEEANAMELNSGSPLKLVL